jgi:hypothetical protein
MTFPTGRCGAGRWPLSALPVRQGRKAQGCPTADRQYRRPQEGWGRRGNAKDRSRSTEGDLNMSFAETDRMKKTLVDRIRAEIDPG